MKNKSFFTDSPLLLLQKQNLRYGQILAESYWKEDKKGVYKASDPNTSEILNYWFYNGREQNFKIAPNGKIYLLGWFTGFVLDVYKQPDDVIVERIIFKPDAESVNYDKMMEAINKIKEEYLTKWKFKTPIAANSN